MLSKFFSALRRLFGGGGKAEQPTVDGAEEARPTVERAELPAQPPQPTAPPAPPQAPPPAPAAPPQAAEPPRPLRPRQLSLPCRSAPGS